MTPPGWYPDPTGRFELRWFDGQAWTADVTHGGQRYVDPLPGTPVQQVQPVSSPVPAASPPPRSRNTGLIVGVVAALAVIGVMVALVLVRNDDGDAGTPSTLPPATTALPATEPSVTEPAVTEPAVTEPVVTEPVVTEAPVPNDDVVDSQPATITGDALPPYDPSGDDPAVGMLAPTVDGLSVAGNRVTIDAVANGPYLVVFLAHWCPHCNREIPRLIEWSDSGNVPEGLNLVGVLTAVSPTSVNYPPGQWIADKGFSWRTMVDQSQGDGMAGAVADAFGASGWPYFVVIGADGTVKARASGEMEIAELQQIIDAALAG